MTVNLTPEQRRHVDQLYDYLRSKAAAPEAVLRWFRDIPRHHFVDQLYLYESGAGFGRQPVTVTREVQDPEVLQAIYTDVALSIQVRGGTCTSSTSQPSLMAQMMVDVGLRDGLRVLEIGTASGWNAALMAAVVGESGHIVSLEVDRELAEQARWHLAESGFAARVTVLDRDGFEGAGELGPYDAVVVTVACPDLPPAWYGELAPCGRLVVPLVLPDGAAPLLLVERDQDGWTGRFLRWTWFVQARGERWEHWPPPLTADDDPRLAELLAHEPRRRPVPWPRYVDDRATVYHLGLFLLLSEQPGLVTIAETAARRAPRYALVDDTWTGLCVLADQELLAYGDQGPADQAAAAIEQWHRLGSPLLTDYRFTLGGGGELRLRLPSTTLGCRTGG